MMIPPSLVSGSVKMSFFPVGMVVTSGRVLAATLSSGNDIVFPFWHVPYAGQLPSDPHEAFYDPSQFLFDLILALDIVIHT